MRTLLFAVATMVACVPAAFAGTGNDEGFAEITGASGALVLRASPSAGASIVSRLDDGTLLRTVGCQIAAGRKWCQVELPDDASVKGWVGMTNLRTVPAPTPTN